jgi:ribonuclease HII
MTRAPQSVAPTTSVEQSLLRAGATCVAGIDEVGRGAWAGPLSVGVAVADLSALMALPEGVRDSKLLSPRQREVLFAPIATTVVEYAIGHVTPAECDALGMTAAQRLGAHRALEALGRVPDAVIVDGIFDFVGHPTTVLASGADRTCRIVAAASVLAKVTRDRMMVALGSRYSPYGFAQNKGYVSVAHRLAVAAHGLSDVHRVSWTVRPFDESEA